MRVNPSISSAHETHNVLIYAHDRKRYRRGHAALLAKPYQWHREAVHTTVFPCVIVLGSLPPDRLQAHRRRALREALQGADGAKDGRAGGVRPGKREGARAPNIIG